MSAIDDRLAELSIELPEPVPIRLVIWCTCRATVPTNQMDLS